MPNHITTILRGPREAIDALLTEAGVDFNRIIPMPDDVITEDDPAGMKGDPIPYPEGAIDWYDWSIQNWGTKWNAYETEVSEHDTVVRFDTAWAHPYPVISALSERFPDQMLQVLYADEDLGSNFGAYAILNGLVSELPTPAEGTEEGRDLACLIKYGQHYRDAFPDEDDEESVITFIEGGEFSPLQVLAHALHGPQES
jgi:hypothetical protein